MPHYTYNRCIRTPKHLLCIKSLHCNLSIFDISTFFYADKGKLGQGTMNDLKSKLSYNTSTKKSKNTDVLKLAAEVSDIIHIFTFDVLLGIILLSPKWTCV